MVVDVELQPTFRAARAKELFSGSFVSSITSYSRLYDVSPVGDRFVMLEAAAQSRITRLHVVLNWLEELNRLVPVP